MAALADDVLRGTEMACEEPLMSRAPLGPRRREGVLSGHPHTDPCRGDVALAFFEEVPPEPLPLVGTTWNLTSIYAGDAVSNALAGSEVTMTLTEDGSVAGAASCNRYRGTYSTAGDRLSLGTLRDEMRCSADIHGSGAGFLEAMRPSRSSRSRRRS